MNHRLMAAKVVGSGGGLRNVPSADESLQSKRTNKKTFIDSEMKLLFNNVFM